MPWVGGGSYGKVVRRGKGTGRIRADGRGGKGIVSHADLLFDLFFYIL